MRSTHNLERAEVRTGQDRKQASKGDLLSEGVKD
jgi:hypothetical protein